MAVLQDVFEGMNRLVIGQTNDTWQVKDTKGRLCKLLVSYGGATWTIDIYDNASTEANQVWQYVTANGKVTLDLDMPMSNGIRVVASGTTPGQAVVVWS